MMMARLVRPTPCCLDTGMPAFSRRLWFLYSYLLRNVAMQCSMVWILAKMHWRGALCGYNPSIKEKINGKNLVAVSLALIVLLGTSACGQYYKVKDPTSDKVYYTTDLKQKKQTGVVILKDAKSGSKVILQNSEITEISKIECKANTQKK